MSYTDLCIEWNFFRVSLEIKERKLTFTATETIVSRQEVIVVSFASCVHKYGAVLSVLIKVPSVFWDATGAWQWV